MDIVDFPESLKAFIEDPQKIKLGVQIAGKLSFSTPSVHLTFE
jgi:hypothetical protein